MVRELMLGLVVLAAGVLVGAQWPDIMRYVKIKQLSLGQGHPENVPVAGRTAYPERPGSGAADGTGDFESASRGGPAG